MKSFTFSIAFSTISGGRISPKPCALEENPVVGAPGALKWYNYTYMKQYEAVSVGLRPVRYKLIANDFFTVIY